MKKWYIVLLLIYLVTIIPTIVAATKNSVIEAEYIMGDGESPIIAEERAIENRIFINNFQRIFGLWFWTNPNLTYKGEYEC